MYEVLTLTSGGQADIVWLPEHKGTMKFCYNPDAYILMQYTGICDQNGTKIYEGDLLQYRNTSIKQVMWDNDIAAFICTDFYSEYILSVEVWNESKIVGNICDTPELLGGINDSKV